MVLYNWHKIFKTTGGNISEIITIFDMLVYKQVPKNKKDPTYKYCFDNFSGDCFLANPRGLLDNRQKYTDKEIVQYIALASRRSLGAFRMEKKVDLETIFLSDSLLFKIQHNRLLDIKDGKLLFMYEEVFKRKS